MNDEVPYDKISGPNRILQMREVAIEKLAEKGRKLKIKNIRKKLAVESFVDSPSKVPPKFDKAISRDAAMKQYLKIPEGAPFWKYTVKDDVVKAPVKSFTISENKAHSRTELFITKEPENFSCGRIQKKLEALKNRYEDLANV